MPRADDRPAPLTLRAPQLVAIVDELLPMFVVRVVRALQQRFPDALHGVVAAEYEHAVRQLVARLGERDGIVEPRDVVRVIGVATQRGWVFDLGDEGAWVRSILGDTRVSSAGRRVERLLAESQRRATIEARNHAIDSALARGRAR